VLAASLPFLRAVLQFQGVQRNDRGGSIGSNKDLVQVVQANTLASMMVLNRGNKFEPIVLPREAQLAPPSESLSRISMATVPRTSL
jgi:hypothetical protein